MAWSQLIKQERPKKGAGGKVKEGGRGVGNRSAKPYSRGGGKGGAKACNNCGVIGHLAGQCPEPSQCHACGSTAHAVADCPHKDKTCSLCGKVGHLKVRFRPPAAALRSSSQARPTHGVSCLQRLRACSRRAVCSTNPLALPCASQAKCRMEARAAAKAAAPEVGDRPAKSAAGKRCNNCGVIGHLAGQCPEPSQCHACGSTAHAVADCPHKDKTCSNCGKTGHLKAKCRALLN